MPKYNPPDLNPIINKAIDEAHANASLDPAFHEQQAAFFLAYKLASDHSIAKAAAHASLATSLRLKAMMNGET